MPNFDIDRIAGHRKTIEDNLRLLEKLRGRTLEDFLTDADAKDAAKYRLQTAIQAMIDITSHICARLRIVTRPDSGECIRALQAPGLLPKDRASVYVRMVRFRNVLVHLYGEVNEKRVHDIIETELDYFRMFLMDIDALIESQSKKTQKRVKQKR